MAGDIAASGEEFTRSLEIVFAGLDVVSMSNLVATEHIIEPQIAKKCCCVATL